MKPFLFALCVVMLSTVAEGQNRKPKIVGQAELTTAEEQSITIQMSDLIVEDRDDWFYPWGFTMTLHPGANYTFSGDVVTPARDFTGTLMVDVTVNDGEHDSNKYHLQITVQPVNDAPLITGNTKLSIEGTESLTIVPAHLQVTDPDDKYPDDFSLTVYPGSNYSVNGTTITPSPGFAGSLSVMVTVNDGEAESNRYSLPVEVKAVDRTPKITGQSALSVNEDESLSVDLADLSVEDNDSPYPAGFTLAVAAGQNYSVNGRKVTPASDFNGKLTVAVTVSDGTHTSDRFNLVITVLPVDDAPRLTGLESAPLLYRPSGEAEALTESITVNEVDGDSIVFAEVGIRADGYQPDIDKLLFQPSGNTNLRAVFDREKGVLTLLGRASPERYTRALRSIRYQGISGLRGPKVIYFDVSDGTTSSDPAERALVPDNGNVALDIPTGFTPNGDQANDTWKIVPLRDQEEFAQARIRVYSKSGVLVYEATGFATEWDGRMNGELLPADTYFYTIDLNLDTSAGYVKGLVTILR